MTTAGPQLCTCTDMPQVSHVCICHSGSAAIQALAAARRTLALIWTTAEIRAWMNCPNQRLGQVTPMSLVMAARGDEVIAEAHRVVGEQVQR